MNKMTYLQLANTLITHDNLDTFISIINQDGVLKNFCKRLDTYYIEHKHELYNMSVVYVSIHQGYIKILLKEA